MRALIACLVLLMSPAAMAAGDAVPLGKLPDTVRPTAYRLDLTVAPERERFSGHSEIDVTLKAPSKSIYLHGRDLRVTTALARVGGRQIPATWTQVHKLGVARLDFATPLPAGKATLVFDYDAPFADGPAGLYRVKVGDEWYAWTQFQAIDARGAFPSFDEPGFKTPFTVSLTAPAGQVAISNAHETGSSRSGAMVRHNYAPTAPLPTYLVAFAVGPFDIVGGVVPPSPQRAKPLPMRIVATKGQKEKLRYALAETPRIVTLLEDYFGRAYPYDKLDQIASPVMGGAMENAGAIVYDDTLLVLDENAPTAQKQYFGMVVAHELAHQWFGNLVTPAWWDDIWLNESFANWMGYRIADQWRPELKIGAGAVNESLRAMNTDALKAGRPIRQPIRSSGEIDAAFDEITYGKGGQVVDMIESYMGPDKFREGVRLHLGRHAHSNATSDNFFRSLAEAAGDPRIVASMRSFVDQQGVPSVKVERAGDQLKLSQRRYRMLGIAGVPETRWTIPFCIRNDVARACMLLDQPIGTLRLAGQGALMPNAGAHGYYRFELSDVDWQALLAKAATLPTNEALAVTDSLWASYRAGGTGIDRLRDAARRFAGHESAIVAVDGGQRLAGLRARGIIEGPALASYRRFMVETYGPRLTAIGFDPRLGAHAADTPDRQKLRSDLVRLVADEAQDANLSAKLDAAATAYLGGDAKALDPAFWSAGFRAHLRRGGEPAARALMERALASTDANFREAAIGAVAGTGNPAIANWLLASLGDKRIRSTEKIAVIRGITSDLATGDIGFNWLKGNFAGLAKETNLSIVNNMFSIPGAFCSTSRANEIEAALRPQVQTLGRGALALDRTVERVRSCGALKEARGKEVAGAFVG